MCGRYHTPADPDLYEYDSPELGHRVLTVYSSQGLSSRYEIAYLAYFLSQYRQPYGG